MITLEQAKELAKEEAIKNGFDFADFVTHDKNLGYVFRFLMKDSYSKTPEPRGLPYLVGISNGKFSKVKGFQQIFHLLDQKGS